MEPKVTDELRVPNVALRRVREEERHESRSEFADALARVARKLGEPVTPSERYIARLEDGEVRYPNPAYRRVLMELCGRPISELGFTRQRRRNTGDDSEASLIAPGTSSSSSSAAPARGPLESWFSGTDLIMVSEWPVWFGTRLAHLITLVDNWQDAVAEFDSLQTLLHQEIMMFNVTGPDDRDFSGALHDFSRRQALVTLAALPLTLGKPGAASSGPFSVIAATEFFLSRCAASITACWHLLRGADLATVDRMLSNYIVALEGVAQQQSKYQRAAARLASQAHRICGIVALHRESAASSVAHCQRALYYSTIAADPASHAQALISLASKHFYNADPAQAAVIYEQASDLDADLSPLQRSRVHAELSVVQGQLRLEQAAIRSAGLAEEMYPDSPEQDPSFLYAEFTPASLTLEHGLTFVALAEQYPGRRYQDRAADTFSRIEKATSEAPARIQLEIINYQATTAVLLNDLEAFEVYMSRAIDGTVLLASRQRQREIKIAWSHALKAWPREGRLKALSERLQLTKGDTMGELS